MVPQKIIHIPTLEDNPADFHRLFQIRNQIGREPVSCRFDFSRCRYLCHNAVAFLGGLARLVGYQRGSVTFDWNSVQDRWLKTSIRQNGFAEAFGDVFTPWDGTTIPYREDNVFHPNKVADYLADHWLGKGWIHVSEALKDAVVERVLELYVNAFEHAQSAIGIFSCGQYFKYINELHLTLVDFGIGIPTNVRGYLKRIRPDLPAEQLKAEICLDWAFQRMTTTKPGSSSRGVGLDLLKSFIRINRGKMSVYSNDGYAEITNDKEIFQSSAQPFDGTIFHIKLVCDETFYSLTNETEENTILNIGRTR